MKNKFWQRNASTVLTCLGGAGVVVTAVSTAKATIKAHDILEEARELKGEDLTKWEKVQVAAPSYVPPVLFAAATIGCVLSAQILNKKQQASLLGAYTLLDQTYQQYRNKVEVLYGQGTDQDIREEIIEDRKNGYSDELRLFYDDASGQFFESTLTNVLDAEMIMNKKLVMRDYLYLSEWYDCFGIKNGKNAEYGWTMGMCMDMYWQTWIDFVHRDMVDDEGREFTAVYMIQEALEDFESYGDI